MANIFISYRREDSAYVAATIRERLARQFGKDSVFFDVDNIPLGVDFRTHLGNAVSQCDVLLAVIGDHWMGARREDRETNLNDPADFVRIEIEAALERGIPVIPVLVDNAVIPDPDALPESLKDLRFRNGAEVRAGRDLQHHLDRLVRGVERVLPVADEPAEESEEQKPRPPSEKQGMAEDVGESHLSGREKTEKEEQPKKQKSFPLQSGTHEIEEIGAEEPNRKRDKSKRFRWIPFRRKRLGVEPRETQPSRRKHKRDSQHRILRFFKSIRSFFGWIFRPILWFFGWIFRPVISTFRWIFKKRWVGALFLVLLFGGLGAGIGAIVYELSGHYSTYSKSYRHDEEATIASATTTWGIGLLVTAIYLFLTRHRKSAVTIVISKSGNSHETGA